MSEFPRLRTGAIAQEPASRSTSFATEVYRFVDGAEQRCREQGGPLRRWAIRLDLLDEDEITRLRGFFEAQQGRFGSFSFEDPWDGTTYPDCSLEGDHLRIELLGESRARTYLVVRQNRT